MRVLLCSSLRGFGGGEEWFVSAALLLAERGHHVRLAARTDSDLARIARERALAGRDRPLFEVREIPFGGELDPRALYGLHALLAHEHVEVAVTNLDKESKMLALASLGGAPLALVPRRGSDIPIKSHALHRWLFTRRAARILVNSPAIAETIRQSLPALDPARIALLPNGVDPVRLDEAERAALAPDAPAGPGPRLIAVGELSERKNQAGLVRALAEVPGPWRLLIVGEGRGRGGLEGEIARLGLGERVRLAGHVPGARRLSAAADLFVHFSSGEGQPWAVLEAMASGVPTVATLLPGLAALLEDGVTGHAVRRGDEAALARAVRAALADPTASQALAAAAQARMRDTHSLDLLADRLERLLEGVRMTRVSPPRRAVFLDRDGTLLPESGALGDPARVRLLEGVGAAARLLQQAGYALVVVTNQAAVGRGTVAPAAMRAVHTRLRVLLRGEGVELSGIFVCPHRPEEDCACRKPRPGLVLDALTELGLSAAGSWLVGDTIKDAVAARAAGVRPALLATGWGGAERAGAAANARSEIEPAPEGVLRAPDLLAFAERVTRG
ncbi:MAG: HAD-IIIA family hydrolase [Candidatus Eisenbacteria bacterium]